MFDNSGMLSVPNTLWFSFSFPQTALLVPVGHHDNHRCVSVAVEMGVMR